jgi:hypothetical protein
LNTQVAKSADAEDGNKIARSRSTVAQGIKSRHACAHERRGIDRRKSVRDPSQRAGGHNDVFGISTIVCDTWDLERNLTGNKIAAPARIAVAAVAAVPADPHALPWLPSDNALTERIDSPGDFMSRYARVLNPRPQSFFRHGVAVANSASLDFNAHLSRAWLGDFSLNDFQ